MDLLLQRANSYSCFPTLQLLISATPKTPGWERTTLGDLLVDVSLDLLSPRGRSSAFHIKKRNILLKLWFRSDQNPNQNFFWFNLQAGKIIFIFPFGTCLQILVSGQELVLRPHMEGLTRPIWIATNPLGVHPTQQAAARSTQLTSSPFLPPPFRDRSPTLQTANFLHHHPPTVGQTPQWKQQGHANQGKFPAWSPHCCHIPSLPQHRLLLWDKWLHVFIRQD